MIGSSMYNYINVLNKAANATELRNSLLVNNLSNVSTPDFKRSDIYFENYLKEELTARGQSRDHAVAGVDLGRRNEKVYGDQSELSSRLDGNNVDIDVEESYLARNQIRYLTLLDSMTQEFSRIKMVLNRS